MSKLDHYAYWESPPPEPSPKLLRWVERIEAGWRPNRRIQQMGRDACSGFYDVYQWEYLYVLLPLTDPESAAISDRPLHRWDGERWEQVRGG